MQTWDLGYAVLGSMYDQFTNGSDMLLQKTDSTGTIIWSRAYLSGTNGQGYYGYSLKHTTNHGYIILSNWEDQTHDMLVIKTDSIGNILLSDTYNTSSPVGFSQGEHIENTFDGGYICAGWAFNDLNTSIDISLVKINSTGAMEWSYLYGGNYFDAGISVKQTIDSGYVVIGVTENFPAGDSDICAIKIDEFGTVQWAKKFGGPGNDYAITIVQSSDSGFIIGGLTTSFGAGAEDVYAIKTNQNGDTMWTKTYGSSGKDWGIYIEEKPDGKFVIFGSSVSCAGIYRIEIDSTGDSLNCGCIQFSTGTSPFICGRTNDHGYLAAGVRWIGGGGIFLSKMDSLMDSGCNQAVGIPTWENNPSSSAGNFLYSVFPGLIQSSILIPNWASPPDTISIDLCSTTSLSTIFPEEKITLSPNPVMSLLTVTFDQSITGSVEIFNLLGEKIGINQELVRNSEFKIDLSNLDPGIYFVKVETENGTSVQKLVKQ